MTDKKPFKETPKHPVIDSVITIGVICAVGALGFAVNAILGGLSDLRRGK